MSGLPTQFYKYFWDTKPEDIDIENKDKYVISRLMDYGHTSSIVWMREQYDEAKIRETLSTMKGISRKSAHYWSNILDLDTQEVACLQKPYRQIPYGV